jgi:hypothetical protein
MTVRHPFRENRRHQLKRENTMSFLTVDTQTITHSIQLAVAPVFFLSAVAGMIGSVAGRLARIVDRARRIEADLPGCADRDVIAKNIAELRSLRLRGRIANVCIALLTLCGVCIGMTIVLLFMDAVYDVQGHHYAALSFLLGVLSFMLSLCGFLWETALATRTLNFQALMAEEENRVKP